MCIRDRHGAADGGGRVVLRYGLAGSFGPGRAWNRHAAQRRAVPDPYGGAVAVSYTHLDVYKRQAGRRSVQPGPAASPCQTNRGR